MADTPPEPGEFDSVGDWFAYLRQEGFSVPVQVPRALNLARNELGLAHQEAFEWLVAEKMLLPLPNGFVVDVRATDASFWERRLESAPEETDLSD